MDTDFIKKPPTSSGSPFPLGSTITEKGVNFSLITEEKTTISLHIFALNQPKPLFSYTLDPIQNRTGHIWHIEIYGLSTHYLYAYQVKGLEEIWLTDPYAKALFHNHKWNEPKKKFEPLCAITPLTPSSFWENDRFPKIPLNELIIYEMHVRGFTKDPSSLVQHPGTFLGIIEKIPYLLDLGVNAIELLPVHSFNEAEYQKKNPITGETLCNFWGYSTLNFFSPMECYSSGLTPTSPILEFQEMVKQLHTSGIEVILDVVFNHTAEGNEMGPTLSYKAFDKHVYYLFNDKEHFINHSGCGNTFRCGHPITEELILNSLRYWVLEMHVDGFRFDLASILSLNSHGKPHLADSLIEKIAKDPLLSHTKLIAEPWGATGFYMVGEFSKHFKRFSEWNDQYRDCVRRYLKNTPYSKGEFATRLCGSQDLFGKTSPLSSLNFITAHDGFTLADLVSYNEKHNLENGEDNRDGTQNNLSWNCGFEGNTSDLTIQNLRERQKRNFHLALMLSQGIPMLLMGDEYGHTKQGNNNTWCQDNSLNWFQWSKLNQNKDFYRFYKELIHFRKKNTLLQSKKFLKKEDIEWHGQDPFKPLWHDPHPFLAFVLKSKHNHFQIYAAFNPYGQSTLVTIPPPPALQKWAWIAYTGNPPPDDIYLPPYTHFLNEQTILMCPYSALVLQSFSPPPS